MDINLEINGELINIISQLLLSNNNNLILTKYKNYISNKLIIASKGLPIFKQLIDSYLNNNILSLTELINNYNNNNNIKFYIDKNTIKLIKSLKIPFSILVIRLYLDLITWRELSPSNVAGSIVVS